MPDERVTTATAERNGGHPASVFRWRQWIAGLFMAAVLWWLVGRTGEIASVARALETGRWEWLLLAALVQACSLSLASLNYARAFTVVGIAVRVRETLPALLASLVVGEVTPVGWATGSAVLIRFAARRGGSTPRAAVGTLLAQSADLLTFSVIFLTGMAALMLQHHTNASETAGAIVLLAMNSGLIGILGLAIGQPTLLLRFGYRLQQAAGGKAEKWGITRAMKSLSGLLTAGEAIRAQPKKLLGPLEAAGAANLASVTCLYLVFHAFHQPVTLGVLIAGFGTGTLAWMVSPIPAGVGVVEGALALALASLGIPPAQAMVIAVGYRGLSFWIPFLLGVAALRQQSVLPSSSAA